MDSQLSCAPKISKQSLNLAKIAFLKSSELGFHEIKNPQIQKKSVPSVLLNKIVLTVGVYFSPPRNFRSQTWTAVPGVEKSKGEKNSWTPEISGGGLKYAPTAIGRKPY